MKTVEQSRAIVAAAIDALPKASGIAPTWCDQQAQAAEAQGEFWLAAEWYYKSARHTMGHSRAARAEANEQRCRNLADEALGRLYEGAKEATQAPTKASEPSRPFDIDLVSDELGFTCTLRQVLGPNATAAGEAARTLMHEPTLWRVTGTDRG